MSDLLANTVGRLIPLPLYLQIPFALALCLAFTYLRLYPWQKLTSPIRNIRGPAPTSRFWGNMRDMSAVECGEAVKRWVTEAGAPTVRYQELLGGQAICTVDPVAAGHILQHSATFVKPDYRVRLFGRVTGMGVLLVEGEAHRRQRRVLNPAFSQSSLRDMMPIFYRKAYELGGMMSAWIADGRRDLAPTPVDDADALPGTIKLDVSSWLQRLTLDVIGLAGFGYDFDTLNGGSSILSQSFHTMMSESQKARPGLILHNFFSWARFIPCKAIELTAIAKAESDRTARHLIASRRADLESQFAGNLEKRTDIGKDVLSLVLKANMSKDLREDQKLTDGELEPQIITFLVAGSETSSTVLSWILWRLATNQAIQDRLRAELRSLDVEQPELDVLNTLPYLENVVREGLRMDGAVPAIDREATKDIVIPLGTPIRGLDGSTIDHVQFKKGMRCIIPIISINRSTETWGPDADEFNPDRYDDKDIPLRSIPGVYGNTLAFNDGARNCIGWRLALAEIKAVLYVLIRNYKFELLPSKPKIEQRANFVMRPRVAGEEHAGTQLPLLVRPVE